MECKKNEGMRAHIKTVYDSNIRNVNKKWFFITPVQNIY